MVAVALWEPEIPPNTGNIARLCAATGAPLHLVGRLGFRLDERSLKRACLDYWREVRIHQHATLADFEQAMREQGVRVFCFSAHGPTRYTIPRFQENDCLLFGGESHGLPAPVVTRYEERSLAIPMPAGKVRSLNLATAVGIGLYEALRQVHAW